MNSFVLEIGFEEMPARFLEPLEREVLVGFKQSLEAEKIGFKQINSYATPRRLVVMIQGLPAKQPVEKVEITGPPKKIGLDAEGNLTKAGLGFVKSQQVDPQDVFITKTSRGEYLAVKKQIGGQPLPLVLSKVCPQVIQDLSFPKKMRWANHFSFGRPIRWILALFESEVVEFKVADVTSSNLTYGHRMMANGPFALKHALELEKVLAENKVVLSREQREKIILEQGNKLVAEVEGEVVWKDDLLSEVVYLVEYPKPLLGSFEQKFLELPEEVLLTSMQTHQKSFGIKKGQKLLPYFLTVINLEPKDLNKVKKGWERVLKARLEDASFFWHTDLKADFSTWLDRLKDVTFLAPLGSMYTKANRLSGLMEWLGKMFYPEQVDLLKRAGLLAKCDLVSEMVGEFPDLQGIMGGIYARKKGESELVATAIYEHYLPKGQDTLPKSLEGSLLSIADKVDTLVGCFGLKIIPTGTADPHALRRNALGIIQIILNQHLELSLEQLIEQAYLLYDPANFKWSQNELKKELKNFFYQRLKHLWLEQGFRPQWVEAILGTDCDNLYDAELRLKALAEFSRREEFEPAVLTFKRVANIVKKCANEPKFEQIQAQLVQTPFEQELVKKVEQILPKIQTYQRQKQYLSILELLLELKPSVDSFFDNVMVMCDQQDLKKNRLTILQTIINGLKFMADFEALQV